MTSVSLHLTSDIRSPPSVPQCGTKGPLGIPTPAAGGMVGKPDVATSEVGSYWPVFNQ